MEGVFPGIERQMALLLYADIAMNDITIVSDVMSERRVTMVSAGKRVIDLLIDDTLAIRTTKRRSEGFKFM